MKTSVSAKNDSLIFQFSPEKSDFIHLDSLKFGMGSDEASVKIKDIDPDSIHPDLIGLATILICHPFVGEDLTLPVSVSSNFLDTCSSVLSRYRISSPTDESLEPNSPPIRGRPGLAFSGGADSTAALAVMPASTVPIFLNRPILGNSMYNSEAAIESCNVLREVGYDVAIVESDLEYVRDPVGFPSDIANAVPAILLSQHLGIDSVAFGTILESAYGIGHEKYVDYPRGAHYRFFGTLMEAAGLMISLPIAGVSEVGTAIINANSSMGLYSQSCIRGGFGSPCLNCWKCFRKEFLGMSLNPNSRGSVAKIMHSSEVQHKLSSFPISHENVVTFSMQNTDTSSHTYLRHLRNRLNMSLELGFLRNWFPPSIEVIPEKYRFTIRGNILEFLDPMTPAQEELVRTWDMMPFLETEPAKSAHFKLTSSWQDFY